MEYPKFILPLGVNLMALLSRLERICLILTGSEYITKGDTQVFSGLKSRVLHSSLSLSWLENIR